LLLFISFPFVSVSAQVSDDWQISPDWTDDFGTPTPPPSDATNAANDVFTNMYIAVSLLGVSFIVLACALIVKALGSDISNQGAVLFGLIFLIGSVVGLIVGFAVIGGFERSINDVLVLGLLG
jgi:hypothetical protein